MYKCHISWLHTSPATPPTANSNPKLLFRNNNPAPICSDEYLAASVAYEDLATMWWLSSIEPFLQHWQSPDSIAAPNVGFPEEGFSNQVGGFTNQLKQNMIHTLRILRCICSMLYLFQLHTLTLEVQDQTKWLVFRMIHIKDSLLPMGNVWSAWTPWVNPT